MIEKRINGWNLVVEGELQNWLSYQIESLKIYIENEIVV